MKVNEFINKLNELYKYQNTYRLGYFMNKTIDGKYLCDCSGLIKACLWGYPNGSYASKGLPDINANTMMTSNYSNSHNTNFYHLPTGAIVWKKGHIGVHIGYGVCMESTPKWDNKIQKTYIEGCGYPNAYGLPHSRKWNEWALLNCIDYENNSVKPLGTYEVIASDLSVRTGPGTNYRRKTYVELTIDGKKHDYDKDGCLNQGTRVTVKKWIGNWALIPSGYVYGDYLKYVGG